MWQLIRWCSGCCWKVNIEREIPQGSHYNGHWPSKKVGHTENVSISWHCHMMTSWSGSIFCVSGLCEGNPPVTVGFPLKRPVTRGFDVVFHVHLDKRLNKQWNFLWLKMLWYPCDVTVMVLVSTAAQGFTRRSICLLKLIILYSNAKLTFASNLENDPLIRYIQSLDMKI